MDYAAKKGFWIYVPTNGRLMKPDVIERLADAGVATFNLAVKASCQSHCFSTLNHIVGYCYNDRRVITLLAKQALHGFQGVRGNVE